MVTTGSGWVNPWLQTDFGKVFWLSFQQFQMNDLEKVKQNSGLSHAAPKSSRDRGVKGIQKTQCLDITLLSILRSQLAQSKNRNAIKALE